MKKQIITIILAIAMTLTCYADRLTRTGNMLGASFRGLDGKGGEQTTYYIPVAPSYKSITFAQYSHCQSNSITVPKEYFVKMEKDGKVVLVSQSFAKSVWQTNNLYKVQSTNSVSTALKTP